MGRWTEEDEILLSKLCDGTLTVQEISKIMDKGDTSIRKRIKENDYIVKPGSKSHSISHFLEDIKSLGYEEFNKFNNEKDLIEYLYNEYYIKQKLSMLKIGKIIGKEASIISARFKKCNLQARSYREMTLKYHCDENYFENINTEEKAYWLGFLTADGFIQKECREGCSRKVGMSLAEIDKGHIEKFKKAINAENPISTYKVSKGYNENTVYSRIMISSEKMATDLIDKGCVEHKSNILKFPTEEQVPKEFLKDFIRGYFDGNGSIKITKGSNKTKHYDNYQIAIVSTDDMLNKMQDYFLSQGAMYQRHKLYKRKKEHIVSCFDFGDNVQSLIFLEWLYGNANVYLDRKYQRYLRLKDQMSDMQEVA